MRVEKRFVDEHEQTKNNTKKNRQPCETSKKATKQLEAIGAEQRHHNLQSVYGNVVTK
jgi:hypothetical protein